MLIDTHCHLNFKAFEGKVKKAIQMAKKDGVEKIVVPGTNLETSTKAVELAKKYKEVYAAVGIHPHHAGEILNPKSLPCRQAGEIRNHPAVAGDPVKMRDKLEKLAKNNKVVAIGECGLDYFQYKNCRPKANPPLGDKIDQNFKKKQKQLFIMQIDLAKKLNLPLILHNREASNDILKILKSHYSLLFTHYFPGVLHCFQGDNKLLNWALKNNFYIGITGIVTFSKKMREVVEKTPLKNLLIETDAPYLMPEPLRKIKKWQNEPKNVKIIAERIAEIKGDSFLRVANQTANNAVKLFKM